MLIIGHYDGHGVASACLFARKCRQKIGNIFIKYRVTGPSIGEISKLLKYRWIYRYRKIAFIDIAIDANAPERFTTVLRLIKQRSNPQILIIDHHRCTSFAIPYVIREVDIAYRLFGSAVELSLWCAEPIRAARELAIVAAICDRDPEVLNVIKRDRLPFYQECSWGLDILVRKDIKHAISACYNYDLEELRSYADEFPLPGEIEKIGDVVVCRKLPYCYSSKAIERACLMHNATYGIGIYRDVRSGKWIVKTIKVWTKQAPTPRQIVAEIVFPEVERLEYAVENISFQFLKEEKAEKFVQRLVKLMNICAGSVSV